MEFSFFSDAADYILSLKNEVPGTYDVKVKDNEANGTIKVCALFEDVLRSLSLTKNVYVSLDLSESTLEIGDFAFSGCDRLIKIILPKGLKEIGQGAFACTLDKKSSLENIILHEGLKEIGKGSFAGCSSLKEIDIPSSVEIIGEWAFGTMTGEKGNFSESCTSLEKVTLHEGLKEIGKGSFAGCSSLKEIDIPASVESIGEWAFGPTMIDRKCNISKGCTSLEKVILHEGLKEIGWTAFAGCSSLKTIDIPASVGVIGFGAFSRCASLEKVILHKGLKEIGDSAFYRCSLLKEIEIPETVKTIDKYAFGCNPDEKSSLEKVILHEGLKEIGTEVFERCSLKAVEIPASVTSIGQGAFNDCDSLEAITFKEVHEWYATKPTDDKKDSGEKVKTATFSTIKPEELEEYFWHRAD